MIVCVECHTEAQPDPRMGHLRLCFWCAELQRLNPHPTRPSPRARLDVHA